MATRPFDPAVKTEQPREPRMLEWIEQSGWTSAVPAGNLAGPNGFRAGGGREAAVETRIPFLDQPAVRDVMQPMTSLRGRPEAEVMRGSPRPSVAVRATVTDGADYLLIVRHASGALEFLAPETSGPEGGVFRGDAGRPSMRELVFRGAPGPVVNGRLEGDGLFRDGPVSPSRGIVDTILVRLGAIVDDVLVGPAERTIWRHLGRKPGLRLITRKGLESGDLPLSQAPPRPARPGGRALLLLHGTFSATAPAFAGLARTDFFDRIGSTYGDAVYGFDHFSVSPSPEDNARDFAALLDEPVTFDVVTHSRGGLVLRHLAERQKQLGPKAANFRCGRVVMVAAPNAGTPLVGPRRLAQLAKALANLVDGLTAPWLDAEAIAHWIGWFVRLASKSAPGLESMDPDGAQVEVLNRPSGLGASPYSALVSNYEASGAFLTRLVDLGLDLVFASANDLVVPTAGGWQVDAESPIPPARIGCFGPGGNIDDAGRAVSHIGFFERPETAAFLADCLLTGGPRSTKAIDPAKLLPFLRGFRGGLRTEGADVAPPPTRPLDAEGGRPNAASDIVAKLPKRSDAEAERKADEERNVLELMVVENSEIEFRGDSERNRRRYDRIEYGLAAVPMLIATYRGARVAVPFRVPSEQYRASIQPTPSTPPSEGLASLPGPEAVKAEESDLRWKKLYRTQAQIHFHLNAPNLVALPSEDDLRAFGGYLFDTLLPRNVLRLFDVARTSGAGRPVVVFTSMIPEISALPWEFARDPDRGTYLATEDVHFMRNIMTPIPIDRTVRKSKRLRMLIVSASPVGFELPAARREIDKIKNDLAALEQSNRLQIDLLPQASPEDLQHALATAQYDVLHFIGHGYADNGTSGLVLENGVKGRFDLDESDLRAMLAGRGLRVVFLNACDSARGFKTDDESYSVGGTAQGLFGRGIPVVVANQLKVRDGAAATFAAQFYRYLAHGLTIAEATREARIAASYAAGSSIIDWAIPVVYARDAGGRLVE